MGKETLGRYEVVGELAQYRVGTVIKATDPKTKQTVALKTSVSIRTKAMIRNY